ncbi:hypothetical protein F751_6127 [Auxenochlorella protothecoides]|uniref:Uncharacterized protein n=1 Tax=Auxenochlorella protothecoides TaxID=3075 RepID=A0A087SHG8_AUXPR|nr:hypothetical protein F751_6127 [Auxenochlorella protothecoides]KFM25172.1 hypothetical protein F751_6127 [Auxenochlorella protothecoides]
MTEGGTRTAPPAVARSRRMQYLGMKGVEAGEGGGRVQSCGTLAETCLESHSDHWRHTTRRVARCTMFRLERPGTPEPWACRWVRVPSSLLVFWTPPAPSLALRDIRTPPPFTGS